MQRTGANSTNRRTPEGAICDLLAFVDAGEDPRHTIRRLDAQIVDCQRDGIDLPGSFLRLSRTLAAECLSRHHAG
jgi:hypothetical protein